MIRTLIGQVTHHLGAGIILDVHGVGYFVAVPLRALPAVGAELQLFTHHHIREQEQSLYGFSSLDELQLFEQLLTVSGIGPKSALTVLSVATPADIAHALDTENVAFFSAVPGLGKKSAAKIIVELKGKIAPAASSVGSDLVSALTALGYRSQDVQPLLRELPPHLETTQEQLAWFLKELSRR